MKLLKWLIEILETIYIKHDKEMMKAIHDYENGNAELIKETDLNW